jgi:amino acid transporter
VSTEPGAGHLQANSAAIFIANFNALLEGSNGTSIAKLQSLATDAGWPGRSVTTASGTIALVVWPLLPLVGAAFSIGIGGEMRGGARTQVSGMGASLAVAVIFFVGLGILCDRIFSQEIQGAAAFLTDANRLSLGLNRISLDPNVATFAILATNNVLLRLMIAIGFVAWIWFWIPGVLSYTQRSVFAWSLDRLLPAKFAELSPSTGVPTFALITVTITALAFFALVTAFQVVGTLLFVLGGFAAWGVALGAGAALPWLRQQIFERTFWAGHGTSGKLFMALCCGIASVAMLIATILTALDPVAAVNLWLSLVVLLSFLGGGLILYFWRLRANVRAGHNTRRVFDQIPIE